MAVTILSANIQIRMGDDEFLLLNGRNATAALEGVGIFPESSVFYNTVNRRYTGSISAASSAGSTTLTIAGTGGNNARKADVLTSLFSRIRSGCYSNNIVNNLEMLL